MSNPININTYEGAMPGWIIKGEDYILFSLLTT